jgi:hydroxymethylpyrimidine pyrophosphatase-like HAD family hydrolase
MEFVKSNANQGLAVWHVAKRLQVHPADILIAGNAINDVEMLDASSGTTVLVGTGDDRSTILSYLSNPGSVVTVDSPSQLGDYLGKL